MPILAGFIFLLALWILRQSSRQRKSAGLPGGRVIYTDTSAWGKVEKPLYDGALGLTGRPDYLVKQHGRIIPVEVKSSRVQQAPYDSHIFQLAAYCLLVQQETGSRPPYGILHYPNATFAIDYTPELESALLDLLADMRRAEKKTDLDRSHQQVKRCARCGYRNTCDQKL